MLNRLANVAVFARRWRGLLRHADGNMMIEFALALPILSMMLIGLLDLGRYAIDKSSILQAARAGAQYQRCLLAGVPVPPISTA